LSDLERQLAELRARLDGLEARMSFLLWRLDIAADEPPAASASPAVLDLLRGGDRAGAIRAYMDETACSLKDAKQYVESIRL